LTAGDGQLSIIASHGLGELGTGESAPTLVRWRWYYHVPSLSLWVLILLLLVLVKGNHNWQAWLILVPPLAIAILWRMFTRLVSMPPSMAEPVGNLFVSLAGAWGIVWLLGHWLSSRRGAAALSLALAVMFTVGGLSYFIGDGSSSGENLVLWAVPFGGGAVVLLASMVLGRWCCRREYHTGRFMAWLLLWSIIVPIVVIPVFVVLSAAISMAFVPSDPMETLAMLVMGLVSSLVFGGFFGGALYVMNLPFMFLAIRCPFYRDRFQTALRLPSAAQGHPLAAPCDER